MSKNLLIVESPAKAKTITKYLGGDFDVKSSVGHIRQIPKKGLQVDVEHDFATSYEVDPAKKKVVSELQTAAKGKVVWLATDPDREGEAIAWHLQQVLGLPKNAKRVTYQEITKSAIEAAVAAPRQIDMELVSAQQARQILDRIVGYELSPVVWRKVPGGKSAGRVQSPALRLIVEREREIENFAPEESFKVTGEFSAKSETVSATLDTTFDSEKTATSFLSGLSDAKYIISDINLSKSSRNPGPPFTTSMLQQEANSRFGYSAKTTMSAAQQLYQAGKITYMRTDSTVLSNQALGMIGGFIEKEFGKKYLKIRQFKTKSASAQEAHEAIRPTDIRLETAGSSEYEKKIYDLIRRRTLASQMAPAEIEKTVMTIEFGQKPVFEAKGEVIIFDGFLKIYGNNKELLLPKLSVGDELKALEIVAKQTFSKPPARYTEGSLVKKLESLGIGRPSTYASIIDNIQTRGYIIKGISEGKDREAIELQLDFDKAGNSSAPKREVVIEKTGADKGKLTPTDIGRVLCDFLVKYFDHVMDYDWTARIENRLDQIAEGKTDKTDMLKSFYKPFHTEIEKSENIDRKEVAGARLLGKDSKSGRNIYARVARFGAVLQLGESGKEVDEKPEFISLDKKYNVETISLAEALEIIALPRLPRALGISKDGVEIIVAKGPFGNYLKCGDTNVTLPKNTDPFTIDLDEAEKLYQEKLASIIADWGDVKILQGKYGPYVKGPGRWNNARIAKDVDAKKISENEARKMLEEKPKTKSRTKKFRKRK